MLTIETFPGSSIYHQSFTIKSLVELLLSSVWKPTGKPPSFCFRDNLIKIFYVSIFTHGSKSHASLKLVGPNTETRFLDSLNRSSHILLTAFTHTIVMRPLKDCSASPSGGRASSFAANWGGVCCAVNIHKLFNCSCSEEKGTFHSTLTCFLSAAFMDRSLLSVKIFLWHLWLFISVGAKIKPKKCFGGFWKAASLERSPSPVVWNTAVHQLYFCSLWSLPMLKNHWQLIFERPAPMGPGFRSVFTWSHAVSKILGVSLLCLYLLFNVKNAAIKLCFFFKRLN